MSYLECATFIYAQNINAEQACHKMKETPGLQPVQSMCASMQEIAIQSKQNGRQKKLSTTIDWAERKIVHAVVVVVGISLYQGQL